MANCIFKFFGALRALCLAAITFSAWGAAEDGDPGWTDNLHTKEGIYAFRADVSSRRLLLLRADNHGGVGRMYRIRLARATGGAPLLVSLRRAEGAGPPWKYGAEVKGWDGLADSAELEASEDGKRWTSVGRFHHFPD